MLSPRREATRSACKPHSRKQTSYRFLKNCTSPSCFFAAANDENVPRLRRFPVFASFFREYKRNSPDFNLRIMDRRCRRRKGGWCRLRGWGKEDDRKFMYDC